MFGTPEQTPNVQKHQGNIYNHPMDYVNRRLLEIPAQFDRSNDKQRMLDRLRSALKHTSIGKARYFKFEQTTFTDTQGQEQQYWARNLLTRHYALQDFQAVDNSELWYELLI